MTTARTRPPTPEESRVYRLFLGEIDKGRRAMEAMVSGAVCVADAERFRQIRTPQFAPYVTKEQAIQITQALDDWNRLEQLLSQLQHGQLSMVVRGADLDIVNHQSEGPPLLGAFPVVAVVIVVIVIAGAITAAQTISFFAEQQARRLHEQLARQAADMAGQPEPIRRAYQEMIAALPHRQNKSVLDRFLEKASSGLAILVGGAVLAMVLPSLLDSARSKKKRPIDNPCGGDARTPDQWPVAWSRDPAKAERQLGHVIDAATFKDLSGWRGWFSGYAALEDEVPF